MTPPTDLQDDLADLPPEWRGPARSRLEPSERILAWFAPDLDVRLRYQEALVLLTDRRVLAIETGGGRGRIVASGSRV